MMKTLIILTATEEKLEYLSKIRADIVLYLGEMNLENDNDDDTPVNAICFNGKISSEHKRRLVNQIKDVYDTNVGIIFFEHDSEEDVDSPDDYTLTIK